MLEWAGLPAHSVHILLSKSDQLTQSERMATLRQSQTQLEGIASVQLFSALKGQGLEEARRVVLTWAAQGGEGE
jgi:GTP-binding protein